MKKLIFSLFALCAITLYSCGNGHDETETPSEEPAEEAAVSTESESLVAEETEVAPVAEDSVSAEPAE